MVFAGEEDDDGGGGDDGGAVGDVATDVVIVVGDGLGGFANDSSRTVLWLRERVSASDIEEMLPMNLTEG